LLPITVARLALLNNLGLPQLEPVGIHQVLDNDKAVLPKDALQIVLLALFQVLLIRVHLDQLLSAFFGPAHLHLIGGTVEKLHLPLALEFLHFPLPITLTVGREKPVAARNLVHRLVLLEILTRLGFVEDADFLERNHEN